MEPKLLRKYPLHLGQGATAVVEPEFTGAMAWYEAYAARHEADGIDGRLVSLHSFTSPWDMWEMHPNGDEVVIGISGGLTLLQEAADGAVSRVTLGPGEYAINAAGVWHTADADGEATALFITAGQGTQHRPR